MKKVKATHRVMHNKFVDGRWMFSHYESRDVEVMASKGRYAMVRRPRAMPYVALVSDLVIKS